MKVFKLQQEDNLIAENQHISIGLDVHQRTTEVVVMGSEEILHRQSMPTERSHFVALGRRFKDCRVRAVYEASSVGYKPLRWLREAGFDAYMTSPALVPSRKGEYVKTDRRDAVKLAEYDRGKLLKPVWDLEDQQYDDRQLVRGRKQLVEQRSSVSQQIKSMLAFHRVTPPEELSTNWTKGFLRWLESAPVGRPGIDACLAAQVAIRRALTEQIRGLDRKIEQLAKSHRHRRRAQLLRTIPGVGTITAMTYLVELGDVMARFETCEDLASFLGLAPGERSSSSKQRKGSTPNGGNKWVGPALVQASWQVIAHDEQLRAVYDRIKAKNPQYGSAIAIVAVARRLALAMRAMLRDDVGWRGQDLPETTDPQDGEVDKMSATRPT